MRQLTIGSTNVSERKNDDRNLPFSRTIPILMATAPTEQPGPLRDSTSSTLADKSQLSSAGHSFYDEKRSTGQSLLAADLEANARRRSVRRRRIIIGSTIGAVVLIGAIVGAVVGVVISRHTNNDANSSALASMTGPMDDGSTSSSGGSVVSSSNASSAANTTSRSATGYSNIVVIGASYCDNAHPRPAQYASSETSSPYYQGRFSNGPVFVEYLQAMIGPRQNGKQVANATLDDRAFGGAVVSNSLSGLNSSAVPDAVMQTASFLSDLNGGNSTIAATAAASAGRSLVVAWIGLNSMAAAMKQIASGTLTQSAASSDLSQSATVLTNSLLSIANSSAWKGQQPDFLVLPIPPIYELPSFSPYNASISFETTLVQSYNAAVLAGAKTIANNLAQSSRGGRVFTFDIPCVASSLPSSDARSGLWMNMTSSPKTYNLSDATTPCLSGTTVCSNPASHLYFDSVHPTTTIHKYLAQRMSSVVLSA